MDPKHHAWLARSLIDAAGGLRASAGVCRLARSRLADFQNPLLPATMPADVIADLEAYCGQAIYSRALADALIPSAEDEDVVEAACGTIETAAELHRLARKIAKTPADRRTRDQILADVAELIAHAKALRNAVLEGAPL